MENNNNSVLRTISILLAILSLCMILTACERLENTAANKSPGTETITPTGSPASDATITPTATATPTPTPEPTSTPTPTPTPTSTPTPTIAPSELKNEIPVNFNDLTNYEIIYNDCFGPVEDVDTEIGKRKAYLRSFGILKDKEIETLVVYINLCYLRSDNTNQDDAAKYLSICSKSRLSTLLDVIDKVMKYNCNHPENQCVISWLGIGPDGLNDTDRMMLNYAQKNTYNFVNTDRSYKARLCPNFPLTIYVYKDGIGSQVSFNINDMTSVGKTFGLAIPYGRLTELNKKEKGLTKLHSTLSINLEKIIIRLENVERINNPVAGYSCSEFPEDPREKFK